MKRTVFFIAIIVLISCQTKKKNVATVTFQIDMSEVIGVIEDPATIGIVGSGAINWERLPLQAQGNDIYSATFEWEIDQEDTIEYTFMHSYDVFDEGDIGVAAYRTMLLKPGKTILPLVKWGKQEANTGRAKAAPMLKVEQSDTEAERKALQIPFLGITTEGKLQEDLFSINSTGLNTSPIKKAVETFLNSLSPEQRTACTFSVDDKEWRRWSNIDFYKRDGIGLPDLNEEQRSLAFRILEESLSPKGYQKTKNIMKMEGYLARLANEFELLGPDLYWFSFMGDPSDTEPWGWQLDGHHLVINYFILGDQVVMTPTFMGSEPNYIADGENQGTRTFEDEEKIGLKLYNTLNDSQKEAATLFDRKDYNYLQSGAYRDNAEIPNVGLKASALNENQLLILEELIFEYIGSMKEDQAKVRMEEIRQHLGETRFSWVGDKAGKGAFYYRIYSPVILIEFDHQKPIFLSGNKPTRKHVHTIVRTPNGNDYGKDLLRQHLEDHEH